MNTSWEIDTRLRKFSGTAAFQFWPVAAALLFTFFLHAFAGWYLLQIGKGRPAERSPRPIEFKVVQPSEPLFTPPQPLPMSSTPPQETASLQKAEPTAKRMIERVALPEVPAVVEPEYRSSERKTSTDLPEEVERPRIQSLRPGEPESPSSDQGADGPPARSNEPGGGGGGGGGGVGDGNGFSEGGSGDHIATGPGGGGIGTGYGAGIGSGVGPGIGSGIGTGIGSGIGSGRGRGIGPGEEKGVAAVPPLFDADYLSNPAPVYPPAAKKMGIQGTVIVKVLVTPEGRAEVVELEKSSGIPSLDGSALDAVKKWRFVPARRGEEAVSDWVEVPIRFRLN